MCGQARNRIINVKFNNLKTMAEKKKARPEDYTNNVQIQNVKEEIVKTEQYDLFTLVNKGKKWFVAIGNNVVTHSTFDRAEQAKKYIDSKPWELILNTCAVMQSMLKQMENNNIK